MLSALAPLFAQAMTVSVADTTDFRARFFEDTVHYDTSTRPSLTLGARTHRTGYTLTWEPMVTALNIGEPEFDLMVLNTLRAIATTSSRRNTLSLGQEFSYGQRNFRLELAPQLPRAGDTPEEPQPGPQPETPAQSVAGQERAQNQIVDFGSSATSLALGHALTRSVQLFEYGIYTVSGGFGTPSRELYPLQRDLETAVGLRYAATHRDAFTTLAQGRFVHTAETTAAPATNTTALTLLQGWSRTFKKDLELRLDAGVAYYRVETPTEQEEDIGFEPATSLAFAYDWMSSGARYTWTVSAGVTPATDRFTGLVDSRAFWQVELRRVKGRLTLYAASTGAYSLDQDSTSALSSITGTLGSSYQVTKEFLLEGGVSGSTQSLIDSQTNTALWEAFMGFTYQPRPLRL